VILIIVADSSALIALAICQGLDLLDALFGTVRVPEAVYDEATIRGKEHAKTLRDYLTGKRISLNEDSVFIDTGGLGLGELEAMVLYKQIGANYLLMDDKQARKVAELNEIQVIGSLGILLRAKKENVITSIKPYITLLQASDIHLSERLVNHVLQLADE